MRAFLIARIGPQYMRSIDQPKPILIHCHACRGVLLIVQHIKGDGQTGLDINIRCPHCQKDWKCGIRQTDETTISLVAAEPCSQKHKEDN